MMGTIITILTALVIGAVYLHRRRHIRLSYYTCMVPFVNFDKMCGVRIALNEDEYTSFLLDTYRKCKGAVGYPAFNMDKAVGAHREKEGAPPVIEQLIFKRDYAALETNFVTACSENQWQYKGFDEQPTEGVEEWQS